jgi:hypothetical protein
MRQGCCLWSVISGILAVLVLVALLFGLDINGKHYGINCSSNGVRVDWGK